MGAPANAAPLQEHERPVIGELARRCGDDV